MLWRPALERLYTLQDLPDPRKVQVLSPTAGALVYGLHLDSQSLRHYHSTTWVLLPQTCSDELVDDALCIVGKVAELGLKYSEALVLSA